MQLCNDQYAPITTEFGFIECEIETAKNSYVHWQREIQAARGVRVNSREIYGDFKSRIFNLLPLTSVEHRRTLFLPTAGNWVAYLDNGYRGTDVFSAVSFLCKTIGCRGVRAASATNTERKSGTRKLGRPGAIIFELYAPSEEGCSFLNVQRSICCAKDGRWVFETGGEPLEFEDLQQYEARRIRDRFTPEMLDRYLKHLGIELFSTEFYEVPEPGYLVYKEGPSAIGMKKYSLDEARENY